MELFPYEKEHLARLREGLGECMVLLKKNGAFPLPAPCSLAAYGSGVRYSVKGGTGSGEVNSRFYVTIEQGLQDAGFTLTSKPWLDAYDKIRVEGKKSFMKQLKEEAKKEKVNVFLYGMGAVMPEPEYELPLIKCADAAIYVVSRISGEGSDRRAVKGDIFLTQTEIRDILALNALYDHFMLVLNVGGPVDLSPVQEVGNILILSQLGTEMGSALADVLLGKLLPSGKLTTTWAAWQDYCPDIDFGDKQDTTYYEGVYVGYRYFDTVGKKPLFPFGFGLSYTDFELSAPSVTVEGSRIACSCELRNSGEHRGKEVAQLYVTAPEDKLKKPYQELAGFAKTKELAPGESETLSISFDLGDHASFDEASSAYILEKGAYVLRLGTSSANCVGVAVLELCETVTLKKVRSFLADPGFRERSYERAARGEELDALPHFELAPDAFRTEEVSYDRPVAIEEEIKALSDSELAYLNVGTFEEKGGGLSSVIGNAARHVAGAAGETSFKLNEKGISELVMADGPAGLRLSRDYYTDDKGAHAMGGSSIPESILDLMSPAMRKLSSLMMGGAKLPKGAELKHQYCTAIPIGTAIAQSWNLDFARLCGDVVGEEMERFGIHLWLAPALNIHRSILCGRNFEYFSEDPLLSGRMAAGITKGVQAHPGRGTTIKHFAANNQEFNRYFNNSRVSERAMREIYLKGFSIAVRESQPHALMTSYNLLNGTHTAELRGLIEDYLRAENGYEGIVMTDWVMAMPSMGSRYDKSHADRVAAAGGELFMPGGKGDYQEIMAALKAGTLKREQLEINASRLLRLIRKLRS